MHLKKLMLAGGIPVALVGLCICCSDNGPDGGGVCGKWCGAYAQGWDDCLEDMGCTIDDMAEFQNDCYSECKDVLQDLDLTERQEAVACLECVGYEAGPSPSCDDWMEAGQDCAEECYQDGAIEFSEDLDLEPDITCNDTDIDIDSDIDTDIDMDIDVDTDTDTDVDTDTDTGAFTPCDGYLGSDECCSNEDPCGWADDGFCDCGGHCFWDAADC
jgi:hypothetical protein